MPEWDYDEVGPDVWAQLRPEYAACALGKCQSPIDLRNAELAALSTVRYDYDPNSELRQENNGDTILMIPAAGSSVAANGRSYALKQFHLHSPSEHAKDGQKHPVEAHFVHESTDEQRLVVGLFVQAGEENEAWADLLKELPAEEGKSREVTGVDLGALLSPNDGKATHYEYTGSLTTPPSTEGTEFIVYRQPISWSEAQVDAFTAIYDHNSRPLQPHNGRSLFISEVDRRAEK